MPALPIISRIGPMWLGAISAGLAFFILQLVAALRAGGIEYPLDDPYIHLAMSEGIARGTYGVNAGEAASAASSILYPLLFVPLAGSAAMRLAPLAFNAVMVVLLGAVWGRVVAGGLWLAALGPVALNMAGVGFTGMEHSAHALASVAIMLGLWRFLREGALGRGFIVALLIAPLLRLESLALVGLVLLVLLTHGRARLALGLGALVALSLVAFGLFLQAQGLPPVPGSIAAKMALGAGGAQGLGKFIATLSTNLATPAGALLAGLSLAALALARGQAPAARVVLLVAGLAGFAHLAAGQIGWMHRYEHYAVLLVLVSLALLAPEAPKARAALVLGVALAALVWLPKAFGDYLWSPRALALQQAQMARLAQGLGAPVAVNDLGRVVWRNPNYVLDLFGLGNAQALQARLSDPSGAWVGPMLVEHQVALAMVYDHWFGDDLRAAGWQRLGTLGTAAPAHLGALASNEVAFFAPPQADMAALQAQLTTWAQTLPKGARFKLGAPEGNGLIFEGGA